MDRKWLKLDDDYLKINYCLGDKKELINQLSRTWCGIQSRASKLGLKKRVVNIKGNAAEIWNNDEIEFLKQNYCTLDKKLLIYKLNRTWSSIQNKAFLLKIKRDIRNANANKLINETNEAYYWLGFIMADGHFSNGDQIQINLAKKDLLHLRKFATFVEYKNDLLKPNISINFSDIRIELNNKFKISNNKTHYPCVLDNLSGDYFFSFIIGFIDGDGCINKKGYLSIKCHKSWLDNLNRMIAFLTDNDYNCGYINSEGLAVITLTKIEYMKRIKERIVDLKLPCLNRKWDRVNNSKFSKQVNHENLKTQCFSLFDKNIEPKDVIKITNISGSVVYKLFSEYTKSKDLNAKNRKEIFIDKRKKIKDLIETGKSNNEIVKEVGTSIVTINRIKRESIKAKDLKRETERTQD